MAKIRRPKTAMGIAVAVAVEALRHPTVQQALRQAPGAFSHWRKDMAKQGDSAGAAVKRTVTGRFGLGRLERRSRELRRLLAEPDVAARLGPAPAAAMSSALDSIDIELKIARQQDLRDRLKLERRIGKAIDALVDALSGAPGPEPKSLEQA
jgi:hypothetical protein